MGWDVIDLKLLWPKNIRDTISHKSANEASTTSESLCADSSTEQFPEQKKRQKSLVRRLLVCVLGLLLLCVGVYQAVPEIHLAVVGQVAEQQVASEVLKLTDGQKVSRTYEIQESSGGTYFGMMEALSYVGNGEFAHKNSGVYKGEFKDSKRQGKGTFTWRNGDLFEGNWLRDEMVKGTYSFFDGRKFTGSLEKDVFSNGTFVVPEGYAGSAIKSLEAKIEDGSIQSISLVLNDGFQYEGMLNGRADIVYSTGGTYSGMMKNGLRDGDGEYKWIENGVVQAYYEGHWTDDKMTGKGTYHYTSETYPFIEGNFHEGKPLGKAIYYKEEDNTFETVWKSGSCISVTET